MRRCVPLMTSLMLIVAAGAGTAQIFPPGTSADSQYLSRVDQAANQLFYQVEQLKILLGSLRSPQNASPLQVLVRRTDGYYEDTLRFTRMLQGNPPREQVVRDYARLDRTGDDVVRSARELAGLLQSARLYQLASRIEHADQVLSAAVNTGGGGNQPGTHIARLARSLDTQAEELLRIARETLKNDPISQQLEREIRVFTRAADQFRQAAEAGGPLPGLRNAFEPAGRAWNTVTQYLASHNFLWESIALRQQTVQVSSLVSLTAQAVGSKVPPVPNPPVPPNPQPPNPDSNPWFPSINPFRQRAVYALGADAGGGPHVRVFQSARAGDFHDFIAYYPDFRGGVRVAVGDVDGDGVLDVITAPGRGMRSLIRVFNGRDMSLMREFVAFDGNYANGVWVAAADMRRDGRAEIICGADQGGLPIVRVFDGATGQRLAEFAAYEAPFRGGVRVAVGDVNGDGIPDIVTAPGPGRPALIRVFDGRNPANVLSQFDAYKLDFIGGAFVAAADFTKNGRSEIVTAAGVGGGPHVRIFDGRRGQVLSEFFAYDQQFRGGARVACRDVNGDGVPDIITAPGPGMPPLIRIFSGRGGQVLNEFMAYDPQFLGGVFVGCR